MTDPVAPSEKVIIVLGCPEVPVQQALAIYVASGLRDQGADVFVTGNPSVLGLLKVSDPKGVYITKTLVLEMCIGEIVEKKGDCGLCIVFAHNDAAIAYAATLRHLLPESRFIVVVFGKDPEPLAAEINFPCETITEKAVHNPAQLKTKINKVLGWVASRT
jgi:threonyl-tRNA synthetase